MLSKYKNRKYEVVKYNPEWKENFEKEVTALKNIFGKSAISITHIGSTSIPGLDGKPTIDILIIVDDITIADSFVEQMESIGYKSLGEHVMPGGTRFFLKGSAENHLCHVHVFQKNHPHIQEMISLKDYLISNPRIAREYSELKFYLFKKYPNDYASYRKHKDEWIERLMEKIKK